MLSEEDLEGFGLTLGKLCPLVVDLSGSFGDVVV